jgi:hypothetical protein
MTPALQPKANIMFKVDTPVIRHLLIGNPSGFMHVLGEMAVSDPETRSEIIATIASHTSMGFGAAKVPAFLRDLASAIEAAQREKVRQNLANYIVPEWMGLPPEFVEMARAEFGPKKSYDGEKFFQPSKVRGSWGFLERYKPEIPGDDEPGA